MILLRLKLTLNTTYTLQSYFQWYRGGAAEAAEADDGDRAARTHEGPQGQRRPPRLALQVRPCLFLLSLCVMDDNRKNYRVLGDFRLLLEPRN